MSTFINGIGIISPQKTAETTDFLPEIMEYTADYLKCIEPNYRNYIDPLLARRLSRLIKMGITSARMCLTDAGVEMPDAIITGTGLGSVEDTEKILTTIHDDTIPLNPTPFMQSTYNTISSQIAINLKCHGYNSTYVHRSFSFESGLIDAMLQLEEKSAVNILAGGIDEMTLSHLALIRLPGGLKTKPVNNLELLRYETPGALAGEGSGYFLLSSERSSTTYARIAAVTGLYRPGGQGELNAAIEKFLVVAGYKTGDVDLYLPGLSGDKEADNIYYRVADSLFAGGNLGWYKHLCGEYHTATSFALWLAANILKRKAVPPVVLLKNNPEAPVRNILIHNHYRNTNHSLILVIAANGTGNQG
jgi:3-oxoacyl-[acyl-carrier-protein] synthase II